MSINMKTTLKVESPALFPDQRGYTPFTDSNEISLGSGDYMEAEISAGMPTPILLPIGSQGGQGSFIWVKSDDSNPSHTAINIYGSDTDKPFMTLYAGEAALVPMDYSQQTLVALTTHGTAKLNWFVGQRGSKAGQSVMIRNLNTIGEDSNWYYCILDTATGMPSKFINTGYNRNDWDMNIETVITDKGWVLRFYSLEGDFNDIRFVNSYGELISDELPQNGFQYNGYRYIGKAYTIFYEVGEGTQMMAYFDGDNVYYHEFSNADFAYLDTNYDECTADGTVVVYAENYNGHEEVFLVNKGSKVSISDLDYNDNYYFVNTYVHQYADFVVFETYDDDNGRLVNTKIFATNGELLKTVEFSGEDDITDMDSYFYGTGKWQAVYHKGDDSLYTLLNYNQTTGRLAGFDKDWTHYKGESYGSYNLQSRELSMYNQYNYASESMAITFGSFNWSEGILNKQPYNLDVTYLMDGQDFPKNHVVYDANELGNFYYSENSGINNNEFILITSDQQSSTLNALIFTKDQEPKTIQLESELYDYDWNSWWVGDTFGDYNLLAITSDELDVTKYTVFDKTGIIDTLVIPNSYETNYRTRFNTLFIREWYDAESCWYFDTKINKFVLLPEFYSQARQTNVGVKANGLNNGKMLIIKPSYYGNNNNIEARVISGGIISEKVVLVDANVYEWNNWFTIVSDETILIAFQPDSNWTVKVYDLNLNHLYTEETGLNNWFESTISCGRRNITGFEAYGTSDNTKFYSFGKLLTKVEVADDTNWQWTVNDLDWWDD